MKRSPNFPPIILQSVHCWDGGGEEEEERKWREDREKKRGKPHENKRERSGRNYEEEDKSICGFVSTDLFFCTFSI